MGNKLQSNRKLLSMAWRDARKSTSRLSLLILSIVLGVTAIVSVLSFSENLNDKISNDSKELLGADYVIDSRYPPNGKVKSIMDSLGGPEVSEINFLSMAFFPGNESSKLIKLSGFSGAYPLYGELLTTPEKAGKLYQKEGGALVDRMIMIQLGLNIGDSIRLGKITLPISGIIEEVSGKSVLGSTFAPPVFVPLQMIEQTGLIQMGSRVEYQYYFKLQPQQDLSQLEKSLDPILDIEGADMDSHETSNRRVGRSIKNINTFLSIIGFVALLLACVGIASSVEYYLKDKYGAMATLKCLGFFRKSVFKLYLFQLIGVGLLGGLLGTTIGVSIQQVFPLLLENFLPVEIDFSIQPIIVLIGLFSGVGMSVVFSLLPLLKTLNVQPIQVLRAQEESIKLSSKNKFWVYSIIALFVFLGCLLVLKSWTSSFVFMLSLIAVFGALSGITSLFMKAIVQLKLKSSPITTRYGFKSLFRPGNQTRVLVLAIGMAAFLIGSITSLQSMLLEQTKVDGTESQSNLLMLDVQKDQVDPIGIKLKQEGLSVSDNVPIVALRLQKINGRNKEALRRDSILGIKDWVLNNEYRVTYTDSLKDGEEIVSGEWVGRYSGSKEGWIPISVADYFKEDAKIKLGDSIVWNVQGVMMKTIVKSFRKINWSNLDLKFTILFPEGILEKAPQFNILASRISSDEQAAKIQQSLVKDFPNISIIDLRRTLEMVGEILTKISWVLKFMTVFTILIGVFILVGTIRATKYQRMKESALLRTLGASSGQVLKIAIIEFSLISLIGGTSGILFSVFSAYGLATLGFQIPFSIPIVSLMGLLFGAILIVLIIGLLNNLSVLKVKPVEVLRGR